MPAAGNSTTGYYVAACNHMRRDHCHTRRAFRRVLFRSHTPCRCVNRLERSRCRHECLPQEIRRRAIMLLHVIICGVIIATLEERSDVCSSDLTPRVGASIALNAVAAVMNACRRKFDDGLLCCCM